MSPVHDSYVVDYGRVNGLGDALAMASEAEFSNAQHLGLLDNNSPKFFERYFFIEAALNSNGCSLEDIHIVPFPIEAAFRPIFRTFRREMFHNPALSMRCPKSRPVERNRLRCKPLRCLYAPP